MALQAIAANLLTGQVIADLPSFDFDFPLQRSISNVDTATGTLHLAGAPENWQDALYAGGALLACYDDSQITANGTPPIVWCGYVATTGPFDIASDDVPVSLSSFEALLDDRVFVGDTTYTTSQHRDDIIADLLTSWWVPNTGISYLQFGYTVGGGPTPPVMDSPPTAGAAFVFQNTDNATVKNRIDQVIGLLGGEYAVDWAFSASQEFLVPTMRWGTRIGQPAPAGMDPAATFEGPGPYSVLVGFQLMKDYSPGNGANRVVPYSTTQSSTSPFGAAVDGPADGRPTFEYRYQPASNISPSGLATYARQAIAVLAPGAQPVTITAALANILGHQLGVDWNLGDDIGYRVAGQYTNEQGTTVTVLAFPDGISGVGRCIGYQLTLTTISPILAQPAVFVEDDD